MDTVFRSQTTQSISNPSVESKTPHVGGESNIEVPYLDYEKENNHPFSVDYFNLEKNHWNDDMGGFSKEISLIETYIQNKINTGDVANSQNAVKQILKDMEKLTNVSKEERSIVKIETLAAHIEFLMKTDKIKFNLRRYSRG